MGRRSESDKKERERLRGSYKPFLKHEERETARDNKRERVRNGETKEKWKKNDRQK